MFMFSFVNKKKAGVQEVKRHFASGCKNMKIMPLKLHGLDWIEMQTYILCEQAFFIK